MNDKNKNLVIRIVTALTLLPAVLFLVYIGGLWTGVLYGFAAGAAAFEYYTIVNGGRISPAGLAGVVGTACIPLFPFVVPQHAGDLSFWWVAGFFIFFFAYQLIRGAGKDAMLHIAHLSTGMLYGGAGMTAMSFIRMRPDGGWWTVVAMVITWANDTAAYFVGRAIGRHKLYPAVSPNKTWEGFFGGMAGSIGGLFFVRAVFFPELTVFDCVVLGVGGGILGPIGDLCESMLKRQYGVKDSGRTVPGHGGMLDRIDALLFNGFLVFCYLQFARGFV